MTQHQSSVAPARAAWLEIDLAAARRNLHLVRAHVGAARRIIAVVKADAYGHGAPALSHALLAAGADMLAVATVDELAALRQAGVSAPVLVLGFVPERGYQTALALAGTLTIFSLEQARAVDAAASRLGVRADVHVKVDSGMNRLGFLPTAAAVAAVREMAGLRHLCLAGAFSHFAASDTLDKGFSAGQLAVFERFLAACAAAGVAFPLRHIANSAAVCSYPASWCNAVRPGNILYGNDPSDEVRCLPGMKPVMTVKAEIARLHVVEPGGAVSYGRTWRAARESLVATLPLGYADGLPRLLSNQGFAVIRGRRAPLIGRVCMDQCMADVTDIPAVREGDIAVLLGDGLRAEELARQAQTINYEITCRFGARLPKVYRTA